MSLPEHSKAGRSAATSGVFFALGAYGWWAIITPVYFRILKDVPALELLSWRVLTGLPVLLLLLMATRRLNEFTTILRDRRVLLTLLLSALLLSVNWFTFVWAVITDNLVEASLGYYVNPLVSIVLGMFFLGERLRGFQIVAVLIAAIGVVVMGLSIGHPPWIALTLAVSFGFYGLLRKKVSAAPAPGLAIEMMIVFPLMLLRGTKLHGRAADLGLVTCDSLNVDLTDRVGSNIPHVVASRTFTFEEWLVMNREAERVNRVELNLLR